jgi:hypothetical protein
MDDDERGCGEEEMQGGTCENAGQVWSKGEVKVDEGAIFIFNPVNLIKAFSFFP